MKNLRSQLSNVKAVVVRNEVKVSAKEVITNAKFNTSVEKANALLGDVIFAMCGEALTVEKAVEDAAKEKEERRVKRMELRELRKISKKGNLSVNKREAGIVTPKLVRGVEAKAERLEVAESKLERFMESLEKVKEVQESRLTNSEVKEIVKMVSNLVDMFRDKEDLEDTKDGIVDLREGELSFEDIIENFCGVLAETEIAKIVSNYRLYMSNKTVRNNVQLLARKSDCSIRTIETLQDQMTSEKYTIQYILNRVNVNHRSWAKENEDKITVSSCRAKYGQMRLCLNRPVVTDKQIIDCVITDDYDQIIGSEKLTTGPEEQYRLIQDDLLVINVSGSGDEAIDHANELKALGTWVGTKVVGDDIGTKLIFNSYQDLVANNEYEVDGFYRYFAGSSSTLKHGTMFFIRINCSIESVLNKDEEFVAASKARFEELDELMGGSLSYVLNKLEERRLAGDNIASKLYNKIFDRIGLMTCTPEIHFGFTGNICYLDGELEGNEEFDKEQADKLKAAGIEISNNFSDGSLVVGLNYVYKTYNKLFGKITKAQAKRLSLQLRANLVVAKGYATIHNKETMIEELLNVIKVYGSKVKVWVEGVAYTGDQLLEMHNAGKIEEVEAILAKIDLFGTKDEFKQVNIDGLNKGEKAEMLLVNAPNTAESGFSSQMANKVIDSFPEEMKLLMLTLAQDAAEEASFGKTIIGFDKKGRLDERGVDAIYALLSGQGAEDAKTDRALRTTLFRNVMNSLKAKIGKMNVSSKNSHYLTYVPYRNYISIVETKDENGTSVFEKVEFLGGRDVERICPTDLDKANNIEEAKDKVQKLRLLEFYSPVVDGEVKDKMAQLRKYSNYSEEELALIETSLRCFIGLKYPTQGTKEFQGIFYISKEELTERVDVSEISARQKKAVKSFLFESSYTAVVVPCDNSMKNALAGLDFDGDAGKDEGPQISDKPIYLLDENGERVLDGEGNPIIEDVELVYGVYCKQEESIIDDYASLMFRVLEADGGKYHCTVIVYDQSFSNNYTRSNRILKEEDGYTQIQVAASKINKTSKNFSDKAIAKSKEIYKATGGRVSSNIFRYSTNKLTETSNLVEDKLERTLFGPQGYMLYSEFQKLPNGVPANGKEIVDLLGLYGMTNEIGDSIGMTVVLGSIPLLVDMETIFNGDIVNFDLISRLFVPLNKAIKNSHAIAKRCAESGAEYKGRETAPYTSIFVENVNMIEATNRFGITRVYYRVSILEILDFMNKLAMLSPDMTRAEWKLLVGDLNHICRALGESSIDVKKDREKSYGLSMSDIVNPKFRNLGNIKNKHIEGITGALYGDNNSSVSQDFRFDFNRFCGEQYETDCINAQIAMTNNEHIVNTKEYNHRGKTVLRDRIGALKEVLKDVFENVLGDALKNIVSACDYRAYSVYKEYGEELISQFPSTTSLIVKILDYINFTSKPGNNDYAKLNAHLKAALLNSIYNLAELEGCDKYDVVRIAIAVAFFNNATQTIDTNSSKYVAKINSVINFFGDLFIQERIGMGSAEGYIPVKLTVNKEVTKAELTDGVVYNFIEGVDEEHGITINETFFNGTAEYIYVSEDQQELMAHYKPMEKVGGTTTSLDANGKDIEVRELAFPVALFAGEEADETNFGTPEFIGDNNGDFGLMEIYNLETLNFGSILVTEGEVTEEYTTLVNENGSILAVLNFKYDAEFATNHVLRFPLPIGKSSYYLNFNNEETERKEYIIAGEVVAK